MFYSDILTISARNQPNRFSRFYKLIAKHTYSTDTSTPFLFISMIFIACSLY